MLLCSFAVSTVKESNRPVLFPLWLKIHFPFSSVIESTICIVLVVLASFESSRLLWDKKQNSICIIKKWPFTQYPLVFLPPKSLYSELTNSHDTLLRVVNVHSSIQLSSHPLSQHCLQCCDPESLIFCVPLAKTWSLKALVPSHERSSRQHRRL